MANGIRIKISGREHAFAAGPEIRIGRDPSTNQILSDNSLVSRRHAVIRANGDAWAIVDVGSRHGTFVHGSRITQPMPIDTPLTLWLGPPGLGQLVQLLPDSHNAFTPYAMFVSYRRDDTAGYATLLRERLASRFGSHRVFHDTSSLAPGTNYVNRIESAIASCAVVIVLIGKGWAGEYEDGRRRIDNPGDVLRIEVVSALELGVRIIPVLVQGAELPKAEELPAPLRPLTVRQTLRIDDAAVEVGVDQLITAVSRALGEDPGTARHSVGNSVEREPSTTHTHVTQPRISGAWWLLPVLFGILGGLIAWAGVRDRSRSRARWLMVTGAVSSWVWWLVVSAVVTAAGGAA
jgi:FHA domain-containing protein/TIR domain-containing protein